MFIVRPIKLIALVTTVFAVLLSGQQRVEAEELKISHFLPPNHTFQKAMAKWGEELKKKSNGKLTVKIYPAQQLGPANRQLDLARTGTADVAISLHGVTPGRYPLTEVAGLPLVYPSAGSKSALSSRRLTELAPEYLAAEHDGLRILWLAVTPPLMFHTSKVQINKLEDFKGLRIRYAGQVFGQLIKALNASPLAVPPNQTTDAMGKGIVDGATFPYEATKSFDLGTVSKYTLEPGVASATFAVVMNPKRYAGLAADLRKLIDDTTGPDAAQAFGELWDEGEVVGKKYMQDKGVTISTLPASELVRMKKIFGTIIDEKVAGLEKEGKPARKFLAAYSR